MRRWVDGDSGKRVLMFCVWTEREVSFMPCFVCLLGFVGVWSTERSEETYIKAPL